MAQLDNELAKFPLAVQFEQKTKVPKVYVASGITVVMAVLIFFNVWGDLLTNLLGFIYPAYASFKALETDNKIDDVQWLTYWVVFAFLNLIEFFTDILLFWLPFYYFFKAVLICWLVLPQTMGAMTIYKRFLRPFLLEKEKDIDSSFEKFKAKASSAASDLAADSLKQQ
ncbi:ER membrane protein DP1/Yop1 [Kappamyces sp. JEL0829]|nr:ER membrane protein DP1/Yop1 [Kappamyces sp. JEL0829]